LDFALSEQQQMMRSLAREFLTDEYPDKTLRAMAADARGYTPELWQAMAEMSLMGLGIPEAYGGVGDFLDLTVVLEEMGRACFLGPYFATTVLGVAAILEAGSEAQKKDYLTRIAEGKIIVTLALAEASAGYTPEGIRMQAAVYDDELALTGTKLFVPDAHVADYIICAARTSESAEAGDGITLIIVDINMVGLDIEPLKTISGEKLCKVIFEDVRVSHSDVLGEIGGGWPHIEPVLHKASVARCAEMVGLSQQALDMTLEYAKERQAFGHPIGAFQAVQHRCADMLVAVEGARFATYQAAWRLSRGLPAAREAAIAKAWTGQACQRVMQSAHQVHGAIGFTEDHILHYYTKKAAAAAASFGAVDFQLEKLAGMI
jgi:alkylation response protein AidB-like acyl-CoA dehydrogenase